VVHPEGLPELFLDRSLGRRQVPALLRDVGLRLRTLAEVYGIPADETVADTEWLVHGLQRRSSPSATRRLSNLAIRRFRWFIRIDRLACGLLASV